MFTGKGIHRDKKASKQGSMRSRSPVSSSEGKAETPMLGRFSLFAERVFIAEVSPDRPGIARTVAACFQGESVENFDYPLSGSPFDGVTGHHACCYEKDVLRHFSGDAYLRAIRASGYAGISLLDAAGKLNGIIVFADPKPLRNPAILESILSILASRVAVEVENRRLEGALESSESKRLGAQKEAEESRRLSQAPIQTAAPVAAVSASPAPRHETGPALAGMEVKLKQADEKLKAAESRLQQLSQTLSDRDREVDERVKLLGLARSNVRELEVKLQAAEQGALENLKKLSGADSALDEKSASLAAARDAMRALDEKLKASENRLQQASQTLLERERELGEKTRSLADAQDGVQALRAKLQAGDESLRQSLEKLSGTSRELEEKSRLIAASRDHAQSLDAKLQDAEIRLGKTLEELAGLRRELDAKSKSLADGRDTEQALEKKLHAAENRLQEISQTLLGRDRELEEKSKSLADGRAAAQALEKKLEVTEIILQQTTQKLTGTSHELQERSKSFSIARDEVFALESRLRIVEAGFQSADAHRQAMFSQPGMGVVLLNDQGRFMEANAVFESLLGFTQNELVTKCLADLTHSDDAGALTAAQAGCVESGKDHFQVQLRLLNKQGGELWARLTGSILHSRGVSPDFTLIFVEDITLQVQSTELAEINHARFEAVCRHAGLGVVLCDDQDRISYVSPSLEKLLDVSNDELISKPMSELVHPSDPKADLRLHAECLEGRCDHYEVEKCLKGRDQNPVWTRATTSVVRSEGDLPRYTIRVFEDLTTRRSAESARKTLEEKLKATEDRLEKASQQSSGSERILDEKTKSLSDARDAARAVEEKLKVAEDRLQEALKKLLSRERDLDEKTKSLVEARDAARDGEEKLKSAESRHQKISLKLAGRDRELDEKSKALISARDSAHTLQEKFQKAEEKHRTAEGRLDKALEELAASRRELEEKSKSIADGRHSMQTMERKLQVNEEILKQTSHKLTGTSHELAEQSKSFSDARETVHTLEDKLQIIEAGLQASEAYHQSMFSQPGMGVVSLDDQGQFKEANSAFESLLDMTHDELVTKSLADLVHSEDVAMFVAARDGCVESGKDHFQVQLRLLNKQGWEVWARLTGSIHRGKNASPDFTLIFVEDFTDRRKIESERQATATLLREAESKLQGAEEKIRELEKQAGLQQGAHKADETLLRAAVSKLRGAEEKIRELENQAGLLQSDRKTDEALLRDAESKLRAAEEKLRELERHAIPPQNATSPPPEAVAPAATTPEPEPEDDDASPEEHAAQPHAHVEGFNEIIHAFITVDMENRIVHVNSRTEQLLGSSHSSMFGKHVREMYSVERQRPIHKLSQVGEPAPKGGFRLNKTWVNGSDGTARIFVQGTSSLFDDAGNPIGALVVFQDFDQIHDLEQTLIESNRVPSHSVFEDQLAHEYDNIVAILNMVSRPLLASLDKDLHASNEGWDRSFEIVQQQSKEIQEKFMKLSGSATHA